MRTQLTMIMRLGQRVLSCTCVLSRPPSGTQEGVISIFYIAVLGHIFVQMSFYALWQGPGDLVHCISTLFRIWKADRTLGTQIYHELT